MRKLCWLLHITLLVVLAFPLALIPLKAALWVGAFLGEVSFCLWKSRRNIALENMSYAMKVGALDNRSAPEDIIKENFRNLGRSLIEVVKLYLGFGGRILDSIEIKGIEHYRQAAARGKGVLFITGHCGNWELLALAFSQKVAHGSVVGRAQNNPYLNSLLERVRRRYGNSVIYKKGALRAMISLLRRGGTVGVLIDQSVLPDEGVMTDFLGRPAWTMKAPSVIARKTGAAVIPVFIRRTFSGHEIEIYPEAPLAGEKKGTALDGEEAEKAVYEDTKLMSSYVERYIKGNPAEWLWIHRRWKRT